MLHEMPSPQDIFESARSEIVRQHRQLRPHLHGAVAAARAAAQANADPNELPSLIILLLAELDSHMAFEESVLLPLFRSNGAEGLAQAGAVVADHARQRKEFAALLELARSKGDPAGLALVLQSLVAEVLADMGEEEAQLRRVMIVYESGNGPH